MRSGRGGVFLNHHYIDSPTDDWHGVQVIFGGRPSVAITNRHDDDNAQLHPFTATTRSGKLFDVNLQVWNDEVIATVDGNVVYAGPLHPDSTAEPMPYFAFGVTGNRSGGFVRISNVRVRRLTKRPGALR